MLNEQLTWSNFHRRDKPGFVLAHQRWVWLFNFFWQAAPSFSISFSMCDRDIDRYPSTISIHRVVDGVRGHAPPVGLSGGAAGRGIHRRRVVGGARRHPSLRSRAGLSSAAYGCFHLLTPVKQRIGRKMERVGR